MFSVEGWVFSEMGVRREEEYLSSWISMFKVSKVGRRVIFLVVGCGVGVIRRRRWERVRGDFGFF